ncbi:MULTISPECIES: hypothetical protein [unclassified Rhizobium]|uniref:hypothetical protein n=1 Tax=unclassified Rhizobium TaxID=2613769 RepID=UPI000713A5C2|nr:MULTISPECIES: hypothetical protein [unclassified Rhizobium]KQS88559.1 hypothetical protein ASG42_15215 [Rhizobium sp. Leaf391]KQT05502.1 hypothetical protein ASG50_14070 [Rhizobium sp. Leaf386]KQT91225.1 hypothetical protein ASG68_19120 [Rhizobium sp. Leaf453]
MNAASEFLARFIIAHCAAGVAGAVFYVIALSLLKPEFAMLMALAFPFFIGITAAIVAVTLPFSLVMSVVLLKLDCKNKWIWISIGALFPALFFVTVEILPTLQHTSGPTRFPAPALAERLKTPLTAGIFMAPAGMFSGWILWRMIARPQAMVAKDMAENA